MLKIKDSIDLKELKKFGFVRKTIKKENVCDAAKKGLPDFYNETYYEYNDGTNTIIIDEHRDEGAGWVNLTEMRQVDVFESDYDCDVSMNCYEKFFDLVQAGLIEKIKK